MKVLLINGSPRPAGCTFTALSEIASSLQENGIDTELFQLGSKPIQGCTACRGCRKTGRCVFVEDSCNTLADIAAKADGIVVGSPVYYAGPNGALCALLDRVFYSASSKLSGKPAAAVVSCRRSGGTAALDRLNKYFTINQMPLVSSQYWNIVHGNTPDEVRQDLEGMQVMRVLGRNLSHLLHSSSQKADTSSDEPRIYTNFIR